MGQMGNETRYFQQTEPALHAFEREDRAFFAALADVRRDGMDAVEIMEAHAADTDALGETLAEIGKALAGADPVEALAAARAVFYSKCQRAYAQRVAERETEEA